MKSFPERKYKSKTRNAEWEFNWIKIGLFEAKRSGGWTIRVYKSSIELFDSDFVTNFYGYFYNNFILLVLACIYLSPNKGISFYLSIQLINFKSIYHNS